MTLVDGAATIFAAIDHCTPECVGIHAAHHGDRFEALEPLRQGVRDHFGGLAPAIADGLAIRHDHGRVYLSGDFQAELTFLGMASSPAFVRQPEGNGCIERFFRTLTEQRLWGRHFSTIEELRQALLAFKDGYNHAWLIERHGYRSPAQVRQTFAVRPAARLSSTRCPILVRRYRWHCGCSRTNSIMIGIMLGCLNPPAAGNWRPHEVLLVHSGDAARDVGRSIVRGGVS